MRKKASDKNHTPFHDKLLAYKNRAEPLQPDERNVQRTHHYI